MDNMKNIDYVGARFHISWGIEIFSLKRVQKRIDEKILFNVIITLNSRKKFLLTD
jgi:hypothetical protein